MAAAFMANWLLATPPCLRRNRAAHIDATWYALLAPWLGSLQVILALGQQKDWFASRWIRGLAFVSAVSFIAFVVREFRARHPIVDLRLLGNRNFSIGLVLMTLTAGVLYGTTAALPIFLQTLMGYPALQSGYAMSPRGIGAFLATFLVGRIVGRIRNRWLMALGFSLLAVSSFWLSSINLGVS